MKTRYILAAALTAFSFVTPKASDVMYLGTQYDNGITKKRETGAYMFQTLPDKVILDVGQGTQMFWITKAAKRPDGSQIYTFEKNRASHGWAVIVKTKSKTVIDIHNSQDPVIEGEILVETISPSE